MFRSKAPMDGCGEALGPVSLITFGIGAIIGTGIFVLTGQVAAPYAGPAIVLLMYFLYSRSHSLLRAQSRE